MYRPSHESLRIELEDDSAVGYARRTAVGLGRLVGLDEERSGSLAVIVTEAGTNIVQHARRGEMLLRPLVEPRGVEVLALDRGPGMLDPALCLTDGYSTGGSRGVGLGSIQRMSDAFDVYSRPDVGTALVARVHAKDEGGGKRSSRLDVGAVCVALPGEDVSGDAWCIQDVDGGTKVLVVDGLGHGIPASEAAQAAVGSFESNSTHSAGTSLALVHQALRRTRGAAAAVASIDWPTNRLCFAGVGNISGCIHASEGRHNLTSHNGTVGQGQPKFQEFDYRFLDDAVLILHSDGVSARWGIESYPGLAIRDPSIIAGVLYRDFSRQRDDATVVALRRRDAHVSGMQWGRHR